MPVNDAREHARIFVDRTEARDPLMRFLETLKAEMPRDPELVTALKALRANVLKKLQVSQDARRVQIASGPRWGARRFTGMHSAESTLATVGYMHARELLRRQPELAQRRGMAERIRLATKHYQEIMQREPDLLDHVVVEVNQRALRAPQYARQLHEAAHDMEPLFGVFAPSPTLMMDDPARNLLEDEGEPGSEYDNDDTTGMGFDWGDSRVVGVLCGIAAFVFLVVTA